MGKTKERDKGKESKTWAKQGKERKIWVRWGVKERDIGKMGERERDRSETVESRETHWKKESDT